MKCGTNRPERRPRSLALCALLAVGLIAAVALCGCAERPPSEPPSIRGTITSLTLPETGPGGSILVEGQKASDTQYDKASVSITGDTRIFDADGRPGLSIGDLAEGMPVEVWFTGPVAESYPVQAQADAIRVLAAE